MEINWVLGSTARKACILLRSRKLNELITRGIWRVNNQLCDVAKRSWAVSLHMNIHPDSASNGHCPQVQLLYPTSQEVSIVNQPNRTTISSPLKNTRKNLLMRWEHASLFFYLTVSKTSFLHACGLTKNGFMRFKTKQLLNLPFTKPFRSMPIAEKSTTEPTPFFINKQQ